MVFLTMSTKNIPTFLSRKLIPSFTAILGAINMNINFGISVTFAYFGSLK